ncbi:YlmC/YmxH family sporulation protein [Alkaliphilus peptidifermentans]|uniref:Sporulation protein, YlmC/YmxH family n=1 Tax=Alkaliphilus peptidifermentans DSM 18978 TaxID=1120976 RepID=A0A1G5BD32_9FIRM|nr:YlmC/YmxH family sporulation protein [Alkaliphilus peptidifermentans]SCX88055.1 sporulation protein, YlmC/YmxH family [Alkaliphilus peptidifermentans DSM 18978]
MLRASELTQKEVINITDGKRIGMIVDLEVDLLKGRINAIIIPGEGKFMGIFGKEHDYEISWNQIKKIGEDVILIEMKSSVEPYRIIEDEKKKIVEPEFIQKKVNDDTL